VEQPGATDVHGPEGVGASVSERPELDQPIDERSADIGLLRELFAWEGAGLCRSFG
jgi:hypothetical protein